MIPSGSSAAKQARPEEIIAPTQAAARWRAAGVAGGDHERLTVWLEPNSTESVYVFLV